MGRPSLAPGRYFRLLLVGYFEGLDLERGIAWRAAVSALLTLLCVVKPLHAAWKAILAGVVEILSPVTTAAWPQSLLWHCPAERH
jgi:hypothetical protein